ncbi:hypothetical protein GCM10009765_08900 [Fodinicola feengrottensis]|uniref:Uncharacterized protein n=1 Tax=Fodinicola feengrottensis TaxID=435914 RepID=A0ABN2FXP1_9ACTN
MLNADCIDGGQNAPIGKAGSEVSGRPEHMVTTGFVLAAALVALRKGRKPAAAAIFSRLRRSIESLLLSLI